MKQKVMNEDNFVRALGCGCVIIFFLIVFSLAALTYLLWRWALIS